MTHKPIIKFENVSKSFDDNGELILKDINFELESGKFYTLLGASGSGKSTILNIIAGLTDATSGDIYLDGERINDVPINKRDVHTVFHNYALLPHKNVFDNIAFPLKIRKIDKHEIEKRVMEALKLVRLTGFEHRRIQKLSGGQKQRVAIARAIINQPKLILADEPTGALDSHSSQALLSTIQSINESLDATILMVTHDAFSASYANRILFLRDGAIFAEILKGSDSRRVFFEKILDVLTMMGGGVNDVR